MSHATLVASATSSTNGNKSQILNDVSASNSPISSDQHQQLRKATLLNNSEMMISSNNPNNIPVIHPAELQNPISNIWTAPTTAGVPPVEDDAAAERRKKAAAARKRRQCKINQARRQQRQNSPRSVSQTYSASLKVSNREVDSNSDSSTHNKPNGVVRPKPCSSATKSIKANIDGISEVARRWRDEQVVAIPTECTYEACISLKSSSNNNNNSNSHITNSHTQNSTTPPDWAYRIERVRQLALLDSSFSPSSYSSSPPPPSSFITPYCWIPRTADCALLQECFPIRAYAMKDTNGKAQIAHRFNETHEVIRRIARVVWPGPVTLCVALSAQQHQHSSHGFWSTLATHTLDQEQGDGVSSSSSRKAPFSGSYLTLRCPRHPLAIKALQQHMNQVSMRPEDGTSQTQVAALVSFPIMKHQSVLTDSTTLEYCKSAKDVQSRYTSSSKRSSLLHPQAVAAVLDGEDSSELFAVPTCEYGEPWHTQIWIHGPSRTVTVVRKAGSTASSSDHHESSNSPSMTLGSPFASSSSSNVAFGTPPVRGDLEPLSLGSPAVAGCGSLTLLSPGGFSLGSPDPNAAPPFATATSEARIKAALRQRPPTANNGNRIPVSKAKERIIQAVLCRWTVVERDDNNG